MSTRLLSVCAQSHAHGQVVGKSNYGRKPHSWSRLLGSLLAMEHDERQPGPEAVERAPDATPPSGNKSRGRALKVLLISLAVVIVFVIAGAVTVSTLNQERTAQATAQEYFEALAAGD